MKRMIRKRYLYPAAVTAVLAFMLSAPLSLPVHAEKQGTDGTEVQVVQPEELEVRLGKEWAGIRFTLETDAGKYPGTVTVGEDGVLRAQIGGSSRYLFSVTGSADRESGKKGEEDKNPWDREEDGGPEEDTMATDEGTENSEGGSVTAGAVSGTSAGTGAGRRSGDGAGEPDIPRKTLLLFGAGMAAAIGGLIALHGMQGSSGEPDYDDDEDDGLDDPEE